MEGALSALDDFLARPENEFRLSIPAELTALDNRTPPPVLYKFCPVQRTEFFGDPKIRFSQRTVLNDPFELTQRWRQIASSTKRKIFADHINSLIPRLIQDQEILIEILAEEFAERGTVLSNEQVGEVRKILASPLGSQFLETISQNARRQTSAFVDAAFTVMDGQSEQSFERITSQLGILSLSDNLTNRALWGLYASEGRGFVLGFDSSHAFFKGANGRTLLWSVKYTDVPLEDFFENPMSLFLTKNSDFKFEGEWRMLKKLNECDEVRGGDIHLCQVAPSMIESVIFGYNFDEQDAAKHKEWLTSNFDPYIQVKKASANRSTGNIDFLDI